MSDERAAAELLRQIPIFRNLTPAECEQLAQIARIESFAPGEVVLRQDDKGQDLWVVLDGQCEVEKYRDHQPSESLVLAVLEPYSHFGEMSFFHPAPHSASVRAQSAVNLLHIKRSDYDRLIDDESSAAYKLAYNAVESLADRLRRMDEWVAELARQNPPGQKVPEWTNFRDKLFSGWNL